MSNNSASGDSLNALEDVGDDLEDIHAILSRRGNMRKSFSSSKIDMLANGRTSDASKDSEEEGSRGRGSRYLERKPLSSSRRSYDQPRDKQNSSRPSDEDGDSKNSSLTDDERRRQRRSDRIHSSRTEGLSAGNFNRSDSAIEKLLEYNDVGNYSVHSNDGYTKTKRKSKSSMNPLLIGLSKSRDSSTAGASKKKSESKRRSSKSREPGSRRRSSKSRERRRSSKSRERTSRRSSKSRERRRSSKSREPSQRKGSRKGKQRDRSKSVKRSSSKSGRKLVDDGQESPRTDKHDIRRRVSSSSRNTLLSSSSSHQIQDKKQSSEKITLRGAKTLRATRSFMSRDEMRKENGIPKDTFEKIWWGKTTGVTKEDLNCSTTSFQSNEVDSPGSTSREGISSSRLVCITPTKGGKKTKLEKIQELMGQYDFIKEQLDSVTEQRNTFERELKGSREESASIKKLVDVHEGQLVKLRVKLAEAEEELELTRLDQRTERTQFSDAAKELAKVNIDYAKSVDEARILKEELAGLQGNLAEREEKISVLEKELKASNENAQNLEADLLFADDQIGKLEVGIKKLEDEVGLYSEAADRDGDNDGTSHLREAKNEAEKRKFEQREKEMEEKSIALEENNRLLEEEMKEFERQKIEHLEEQKLKENDFKEKRAREEEEIVRKEEELKNSYEDRLKKEEDLNKLLNELKDENTALNGRLKSEQLQSTMKLQNKDNTISELKAEVTRFSKEQQRRDSAPDSSSSLIVEIENLKTEASRRHSDFEVIQVKKVELEDEIEGLQNVNIKVKKRLSDIESEVVEQKKEVENQRRKALDWQKKTGEWSEKAVVWKQRAEHWEKKAKESGNDNASSASEEGPVEPQALFLAAAVEKKAANISANANGSWRLGRRIFGMSAVDDEDETQVLINKLEGENYLKENEIRALKSEMVKTQTIYKEQAYSKTQAFEKLQKEMEAIELRNTNLLQELEMARKLNRTISDAAI